MGNLLTEESKLGGDELVCLTKERIERFPSRSVLCARVARDAESGNTGHTLDTTLGFDGLVDEFYVLKILSYLLQ